MSAEGQPAGLPKSAGGTSTRPTPAVFDFTARIRAICVDISARLPELSHVRMEQVAVSFSQARSRVLYGLQAKLTPLRFESGSLEMKRHGRTWTVQRLRDKAGQEMLYILSFYLPRFLDQSYDEKLTTLFHELWHISAAFDGDLRRHPGRCFAHSHSQKQYDAFSAALAEKWLRAGPPEELYAFLRLNFAEVRKRYGNVIGQKIRTPKLIPLPPKG